MVRSILSILALVAILFPTRSVLAQAANPPPEDGWHATYWNNPSLAGFWRVQRLEEIDLNYDWGENSPADRVNEDYWSARWERTLRVQPGNYRFTVAVSNGVRLWIDNRLVIDEWASQWMKGGDVFVGDAYLDKPTHQVRVDYFNTSGPAAIQVRWEPYTGPPATDEGWLAEYYNNPNLSGNPVMIRDETEVSLDVGSVSPLPGTVNPGNFSVRWSRALDLAAGTVEFSMRVDDGARLRVGGELLIDGWGNQGLATYTEAFRHAGGPLQVVMEYNKQSGHSLAQLTWEMVDEPPSAEPEPEPAQPAATTTPPTESRPPTPGAVIVNHGDDGFVTGGPQQNWQQASGGYEGQYRWAFNHQSSESNYVWGRWFPDLEPGRYEVWVHIPNDDAASRQARYWVVHSGQYVLRVVDQAANRGSWVSLGVYAFSGGDGEYLSLADVTYEASGSVRVLWDAVRWERTE